MFFHFLSILGHNSRTLVVAALLARRLVRDGGLDVDDLPALARAVAGAVAAAATLGQLLLRHDAIDFCKRKKKRALNHVVF